MTKKSFVDTDKLKELNDKIYEVAYIDREHLLEFLTLVDTNDAKSIVAEVEKWLNDLHGDPHYSKIRFPQGDIEAVLGDLDSYGRVQPETVLKFKEQSNKTLPIS